MTLSRFILCLLVFTSPAWATEPPQAELTHIEIITGEAKPEQVLPLVIALHGMGDRPEHFARIFQDLKTPARVILVQAPDPWHRGFSWFGGKRPRKPRSVYSGQVSSSADRVAKLTRHLAQKRPTRGKPIITGFSQGGMLSFVLATRHPNLFGLSVPLGGVLPSTFLPKTGRTYPTQVVALHGQVDTVMPLSRTQTRIKRMKRVGMSVEIEVFANVGHRIPLKMQHRLHQLITGFVEAL